MGKAVNKVFLIGRLTRDVELRNTTTGKSVASFSLAVDKSTGEGADFFECVAWEKTAELLQQYTGKGSKLHVEGSLQQREYEAKDGTNRRVTEVVVRDITFLDNKSDSQANTNNTTKKDTVVEDVGDEPINLDDIPF